MQVVMTDRVDYPPQIQEKLGRAWCMNLRLHDRYHDGSDPLDAGSVDQWLIERPGANPLWHSYVMFLMHLRPIPGKPDARIYEEGRTHQMVLYALDPEADRNEMIERGFGLYSRLLDPVNFAAQITCESDELARDLIYDTVCRICDGRLNPDSEFRQQWIARFGDNMMRV